MATRYHFVSLEPTGEGFGEYKEGTPEDEGYVDLQEMITDSMPYVDLYELGVDELPEGARDIRGYILTPESDHERVAVYAVVDRDGYVGYQSVVATEEPVSAAGSEE